MHPLAVLTAGAWLLASASLRAQEIDAARWTITGTVVDADGHPLANIGVVGADRLALRLDTALDQPQVRTDRQGRFELVAMVQRDQQPDFGLLLGAPGRVGLCITGFPGHLEGDAAAPRRLLLGAVTLYPAGVLIGSVRDPADRPLAGVQVYAEDLAHTRVLLPGAPQLRGVWSSDTVSDAHGTFRLRGVPPTALSIHCRHHGYYDLEQQPVLAGETPVLTLQPSGFVRGRLLAADGRPLPAQVELVAADGDSGPIATTAADGSFCLSRCTRGAFMVRTRPWHEDVPAVVSPLLTDSQSDLCLRHDPKAMAIACIAVRFRGTSAPLPGARIAVHYGSGGSFDPWSRASDWRPLPGIADGEPIAVPPSPRRERTALVRVSAPGFASRVVRAVGAAGAPPLVLAELEPECTISGRVAMARNQPGPVQVWVQPQFGSDRGIDWAPPAWAVTADAQGNFVLRGLQPGCYRVHATGPHLFAAASRCELQPGGVCTGVLLQQPPELLAGELDVTSAPINPERYLVRASHAREGADGASLLAAVSGTGAFALPVASPATCLELLCPGPDHLCSTLQARLGHPRLEFAGLDSNCNPGELRGSIDLPAAGGDLRRVVAVATGNEQVRLGQVDAGGRFRLLLSAGTWEIELVDLASGWLLHRAPATVQVRGREVQELALHPRLRNVTVAVVGELALLSAPALQASATTDDRRRLDQRSKSWLRRGGLPLDPGQQQVTVLLPQEVHELVLTSGLLADEQLHGSVRVQASSALLTVQLVTTAALAGAR